MATAINFHRFNLIAHAGLARQFLFSGAVLLMFDGSAFAQAPIKTEKINRTLIVSDSVQLAGSRISGGWREHAADGSWRRVAFVLDGHVATVTFGDGKNGSRVPSVSRYIYAGPGGKDAKTGDAPAVYSEAHIFADATPGVQDRAKQSSPVPADVAMRVRELGGDIKLMQQAADIKRISELGSAFDAAGSRAADDRFFGDRPGGAPRRNGGGWTDPRGGVGRDGRAGDGATKTADYDGGPKGPDRGNTGNGEIRHADDTTTTFSSWNDANGHGNSETHKDASGNTTHGGGESVDARGNRTTTSYVVSTRGEVYYTRVTVTPEGHRTEHQGSHHGVDTPSETPYSGRGGFDEAWMDKSLPWFMDTVYLNWKRESDLVQSGGRIAQPGRGDDGASPIVREGPRVGASAVTNCGDAGTNPCARFESAEVDARERMNTLTQPPRGDDPRGGPGGMGVPGPVQVPPPKQ